jgi:hypothetical protein
MFDLIFGASAAWNQALFLLGGLLCLGLGGLLVGNRIHWRLHALRVTGEVIGVRQSGGTYAAVYRYTLPSGETCEGTSDSSSNSTDGKATGTLVPLLVFADKPESVEPAHSIIYEAVGLFIMTPGVVFTYVACTSYPFTPMTFIVLLALSGYAALKIKGALSEWKAAMREKRLRKMQSLPVVKMEDILASPDGRRTTTNNVKNARIWPLFLLLGLAAAAGGVYEGKKVLRLEQEGLRATGRVVEMKSEWSSGSNGGGHYVYYPIVDFTAESGQHGHFKGRAGSNPPSYHSGEDVTVLYLQEDPSGSAMIDSGPVMNWCAPMLIFLAGVLFAGIGIMLARIARGSEAR